ncbi:MAG: serine hydrolase [Anaerolineae bacterium]|nr:serine hydrolase [Anaerolineae bacterium]
MIGTTLMSTLFGNRLSNKLDVLVSAYVKQGRFSGAVLVAQGDHVLLNRGYGLANHEYNVPAAPHTRFRIGSMTKAFTALAIMQMVEQGKLALTDHLSRFFPTFPNADRITIQHLLANTSGIEDFISLPEYASQMIRPLTHAELLALFEHRPLRFEPGTEFGYSNSNWVLLGLILEQLTGQSYADVMYQRLLQPAGMTNSGYYWSQPLIKDRAQGYVDTGKVIQNAEVVHEDAMYAAGALYSTVEDLYRWSKALEQSKLVTARTLDHMTQPITVAAEAGYGLGWELHTLHGHRAFGHSGGLPGFTANFLRFPHEHVTLIILSNLGSAAWEKLTSDLAAIVFDQPYTLPADRAFVTLDPSVLAEYAGTYSMTFFGRTALLTFAVDDGVLTMSTPGLPTAVVSALGGDKFYTRSKGEVELTFIRDGSGKFTRLEALWGGHDTHAERIA